MISADELYSKFEFTEDNHIKFWYDGDASKIFRENEWEITSASVGACNRIPMNVRGEIIRTAKIISRKHKEKMSVFFSGGLDSEIAINAWIESRAPFTPVIVKFINDLNIDDVSQAVKFCDAYGLNPTILDFDPVKFYESGEWQRVAKDYQSYTFYQQILLKVAEEYAAPLITIDEVELEKVPDMDHLLSTGQKRMEWVFLKKEDQDGVWRRFVAKTGIPAYNNFYTYNPETMSAFFENNIVNALISDRIPGKMSWTSSKNEIYKTLSRFPFELRRKRTGVENMFHIWTDVEHRCANLVFATDPRIYEFPVHELIKNLKEGKETVCDIL